MEKSRLEKVVILDLNGLGQFVLIRINFNVFVRDVFWFFGNNKQLHFGCRIQNTLVLRSIQRNLDDQVFNYEMVGRSTLDENSELYYDPIGIFSDEIGFWDEEELWHEVLILFSVLFFHELVQFLVYDLTQLIVTLVITRLQHHVFHYVIFVKKLVICKLPLKSFKPRLEFVYFQFSLFCLVVDAIATAHESILSIIHPNLWRFDLISTQELDHLLFEIGL